MKWFLVLLSSQILCWNHLNAAKKDLSEHFSYFKHPGSVSIRYKRLVRHHPPLAKQRLIPACVDELLPMKALPLSVSMFQSRLHGHKQGPVKCKAQKSDVHGSELTMDLPGPPLLSWLPAFHSTFLTVVFIYLWDHFDPSLSSLVDSVLQYDRVQNSFASHYRCPWIFNGSAEAEAEAPVLWPPGAESWLTGEDPDARKDWV